MTDVYVSRCFNRPWNWLSRRHVSSVDLLPYTSLVGGAVELAESETPRSSVDLLRYTYLVDGVEGNEGPQFGVKVQVPDDL